MTKLNYERKGPPRPGSGLGHPFGAERPFKAPKTNADRKREKKELATQQAEQQAEIAPERARQARRDARKALKKLPGNLFPALTEIPKPPKTKS